MNNSFCIATSMQKKVGGILPCLFALFLLASCQSYKKVPYLRTLKLWDRLPNRKPCMMPE